MYIRVVYHHEKYSAIGVNTAYFNKINDFIKYVYFLIDFGFTVNVKMNQKTYKKIKEDDLKLLNEMIKNNPKNKFDFNA